MATSFRLTFNLPTQKYFFDGDVAGTRINVSDDGVQFMPVYGELNGENNEVPLVTRQRGGFETTIDGENADDLLATLTREGASSTHPFFIVKKAENGWVGLQHFTETGAPPKFSPHMRVWFPRDKAADQIKQPMNDELKDIFGTFVDVVRVAKQVIDNHKAARGAGRPSLQVIEARSVIDALKELVAEILPQNEIEHTEIKPVQMAVGILNDFLKTRMNGHMTGVHTESHDVHTESHDD